MSLKVWLPLMGDLRNLGTSNYEITPIGTATYVNGKIGQCYQRATSDAQLTTGIKINNNLLDVLGTHCSVAVWVKPLGTHTHYNGTIFSSGNWNAKRYAFGVSLDNTKVDVLSGSHNNYINCAVPQNEWTHLVSVFDNGTCLLYKNGIYVGLLSNLEAFKTDADWSAIGRDTYAGGYFGFHGLINDFRLYDHCLSLSEIKEIALGLILHYKFDDKPINSSPNLVTSITKGGLTTIDTTKTFGVLTSGSNADTYFTLNLSESITVGLRYLLSCYASGIPGNDYWTFPLGTLSNSALPFKIYNGFNHIEFVANDISWGSNRLFLDDTKRISSVCKFYNFILTKLENEVKDSSGYNHNGEIIGELHVSNDSARYKNSTLFDGIDDCIIVPYNTICPENIFTINLWFKKDALGSKNYETLFGGPGGFEMDTRAGSATSLSLYMASTRSGNRATGITMNEWHMITMTRDGTTEKYYVDGEFKSEIKAKPMPNGVYRIGAWASNTGLNYYGLISDFRIYATPLLDSDIKKLYNTSMSVDRANNDFIYELDENDSNRELMQGIHLTNSYGSHTLSSLHNKYNENGEPYLDTNGSSIGSDYIYINPTGKTYYYDIELSCNTGNLFYIGFHRYDKDKTPRSNDACAYIIAIKPTSDIVHKRYFGTVNLSTDGTNPCDSISLRVLNGWSGTTSGVTGIVTIHRFSLREVASLDHLGTMLNGILLADEFKEYEKASIYKNGIIEAGQFIER